MLSSADPDAPADDRLAALDEMLEDVRIEAKPEIVQYLSREVILGASIDSDLVFLPFRLRDDNPVSVVEGSLDDLLERLPIAALVYAAQDIPLDVEPEAGAHAAIAETLDAASKAEDNVKLAAKNLEEAEQKLEAITSIERSIREQEP